MFRPGLLLKQQRGKIQKKKKGAEGRNDDGENGRHEERGNARGGANGRTSGEKGRGSARGHLLYMEHPHAPHPLPLCLRSALTSHRVAFLSVKAPIVFLLASPPFTFHFPPSAACFSAMAVCFGLGPCLLLWCMTSLRDKLFSAHESL